MLFVTLSFLIRMLCTYFEQLKHFNSSNLIWYNINICFAEVLSPTRRNSVARRNGVANRNVYIY